MLEQLKDFFSGNFMAHGNCYLWKPQLVLLHAGSDFLIALAYYSIPLLLFYFVRRRHDLPFQGIFLLFCVFIWSCGTGHVLEVWTLWHPNYWLSGLVKALTAVVSLYTASELVPLMPKALALPSPAQLEAANLALEKEVTEHKQTVAALEQSQRRLSLLVQQTPLAVIEWSLDGRVCEWNPAAQRMFGYSRQEAIGRHANQLMGFDYPPEQFEQHWQNLLVCQGGSCNTSQHQTPEGKPLFCEWYNLPLIEPNGEAIGVTSLVQDITKRKEAEEALHRANEELEQRVRERTRQLARANEVLQAEINERELTESALRESETRLHAVVTKAPIILYATDRNGTLTLLEGRGLERLGYQHHSGCLDLELYRHQLEIDENLPNVLAGVERAGTVRVGDSVYQNWAAPLRDSCDRTIGLIGVATDITERHQAEAALAERERYLAALVEVQHQLLAIKGEDGCYAPILELLGRSANASHVYLLECEEENRQHFNLLARWGNESDRSIPEFLPYHCCLSRWTDRLARGMTLMGHTTELPEAKRRIFEKEGISSLLVLPLRVKNQFFGLIIFGSCDEERLWSDSAIALLQAAAAALSLQHERTRAEVALRQSEIQLREQASQLAQTLDQLKQAQAQLVQSEKMSSLGLMVAGIAHEINNPVGFVYGNIGPAGEYIQDLLQLVNLYQQQYPEPTPPIRDYIDEIDLEFLVEDLPNLLASMKMGAERIRDIVLSLRTFSRLDEAKAKRVNLHEGLDATLLILQHRLKERPDRKGIAVVKKYGNLPHIECYPGQLNQVFMNILANAIDALESSGIGCDTQKTSTPHSSPQIQICTEVVEETTSVPHSQSVVIRIIDNGPGMTERVRQRLFDPFFTTKPIGQGTGLGLSISYQIVVGAHNGQLQCISAPQEGTEFVIQIPVVQSGWE
jgi:PAS domain S-box-containing protein